MLSDAQDALDDIVGDVGLLQAANGLGRIFELYVMLRLDQRLKAHGLDVWLQRSDETHIGPSDPDRRFIQRGGRPSGVAPKSQGPNNETAILFQKAGGEIWEIWNGIQFKGRSDGLHELDIAIVPNSVGIALRAGHNGGIPVGKPRVAIECKDVGTAGSIDETRAFIARLYDLTFLNGHYHPSYPKRNIHPGAPPTSAHDPASTFQNENHDRSLNAIARRTGFVGGTTDLAPYYGVDRHGGIIAGSSTADDLIDDVTDWILANLA
jgi:hypothetical protein